MATHAVSVAEAAMTPLRAGNDGGMGMGMGTMMVMTPTPGGAGGVGSGGGRRSYGRTGGPRPSPSGPGTNDPIDLNMSPVAYEPLQMRKNGSRRLMNKVKQRAGGDPRREGKWRVFKLGDGRRVTCNLVCAWCGHDNTASNVFHKRIRCDLCDRPFKQRAYVRAVGGKQAGEKLYL